MGQGVDRVWLVGELHVGQTSTEPAPDCKMSSKMCLGVKVSSSTARQLDRA